jgi:3-oxoacyl-[acyl-carrier protein] reductase
MIELSLKDKIAVVCGASKGIGAAIAESFKAAGAQVVSVSRTHNNKFDNFTCDLGDLNLVERASREILAKYQKVHILVNNSGGPKGGSLLDADTRSMTSAYTQHVLASQLLAKNFVPSMKSEQYGRIINVLSTSVKTPIPNLGVSNTIRGAMNSWSKTLANELGEFGITVNNLLPGFTKTERLETLRKSVAERLKMTEDQVTEMWLESIPMHRFAEPSDLANAALYLASPLASYVTGISLTVDGGRTPSL